MGRKRFTAEQIIKWLREAEVLLNQALTLARFAESLASQSRVMIAGGKTTVG